MTDWRALKVDGVGSIDRVVGVFEVYSPFTPFARFKVKVIERADADGRFLAVANVAVKGSDGSPAWEAGLGDTPEDALRDHLERFVRDIRGRAAVSENDFVWADPHEF